MSYELYPAEKSGWDQLCTEHRITGQEKLAMQGILERKTNTDIAENLNISKNTVTKYIAYVYKKLKIISRHELLGLMKGRL